MLEKGILWAEKEVAPVLIEGVFDADKTLTKRIKASAKFVSAEEEAAKRKLELENLKSRSMMANAAEISEDELSLADPVSMPESSADNVTAIATNNVIAPATTVIELASATSSSSSESASSVSASASASASAYVDLLANVAATPMTPTRTPRKHSILTHTNPELLNTLNKMFVSPNPHAPHINEGVASGLRSRTPNRRASVAIGATASSSTCILIPKESDRPKEIKKSKSKLLKKMLGDQEEEEPVNKIGLAATLPSEGRPMAMAMAMAMALGGAKPPGAPGGGMSFLDQIKARRAKESGENTISESPAAGKPSLSTPPMAPVDESDAPAPAPMPFRRPPKPFAVAMGAAGGGAPGGGMSFLEQIKARRKNDE